MRVNTTKSLQLASRVKQRYGTWQAVKQASRLVNGVYVLERPPVNAEQGKPQTPKTGPATA